MLFGVFDGHSGPACAQILAKRLFDYICAGLLSKDILQKYAMSLEGKNFVHKFKILISDLKFIISLMNPSFFEIPCK